MTNADSPAGKGRFMLEQLLHDSVACSAVDHPWRNKDHRTGMKQRQIAVPAAAPGLLERINARRARGESFASIAAALNKEGFSGGYGGRWYAGSVWAYQQRHSQVQVR